MNKQKNNLMKEIGLVLIIFLGILLICVGAAYAKYSAGDIVSFEMDESSICEGPFSHTSNWYGAPTIFSGWSVCETGNTYGFRVFQHKIYSDSGCDIKGMDQNGRECVRLDYVAHREPDVTPYAYVIIDWYWLTAKQCYQEVGDSEYLGLSDNVIEWDVLINYDRCTAKNNCGGDPCQLICPPHVCESTADYTHPYDVELSDYKCVPATTATGGVKPAAGGSTAATTGTDPKCCDQVENNNYTWCPSNQKGGCCAPGKKCCSLKPDKWPNWAKCCELDQDCAYVGLAGDYCDNSTCPDPEYPQLCPGRNYSICCKPAPVNTCGIYPSKGVAYCKTCSEPDRPVECPDGICCKANQECQEKNNMYFCSAVSCSTPGEELCESIGIAREEGIIYNICCKIGECQHDPKGTPYCAP